MIPILNYWLILNNMKNLILFSLAVLLIGACSTDPKQDLVLNDLEYFESQGVNILVYSNLFTGGFNDEKTAGIELIHHGVRTAQGGAVRLSYTPEQWDLVPKIPSRTVDSVANSIEATLRNDDWPFLWGQNEGTIGGNTSYLIFGAAFKELVMQGE